MTAGFQHNPIGKSRPRARFNLRVRLWGVGGLLAVVTSLLLVRAAEIQIVDHDFYERQADARILREVPIPVSRGMITDRHGEPLAVSTPVESLWVNPQVLSEHVDRLPELARAIGRDAETLTRDILERRGREFLYLPGQRRLNPQRAHEILALGIPGVFSQREFKRFYPQGEALAHVLGYTNIDDVGQEGLELAFDGWLAGEPGVQKIIRDRDGNRVEHVDLLRPAVPGRDLMLSIDRRLQFLAWRELAQTLTDTGATSGSVVMLDVATGEVLAMVNLPAYNNNIRDSAPALRRNRAVTDLIEPGSVMKPFTIAAGLEAGVITPETRIDTNPGWIPNGRRYRTEDVRNYGELDITGIITKSSNVGVAKIARQLTDDEFYQVLHRFGFGQSTDSGFPGESPGLLPDPSRWDGTSKQTMSYGYALSVTPLQLAQAYATLGNGGRRVRPSFVHGGNDPLEAGVVEQVIAPELAQTLVQMMRTTTGPSGTARRAAIPGYHVAGKTGTARRAHAGGYASGRYTSFFAGLVPAGQPRLSVVVAVHDPDPDKGYYGGAVSAPVFREVMQDALRLLDVPPDDMGELRSASLLPSPSGRGVGGEGAAGGSHLGASP